MKWFVPTVAASLLFAVHAWAGEKEDATKFVNDAAAAATKDKTATLAELSNPKGRFVKGEIYAFAFDLTGTVVAHPINSKLIGKNTLEMPDADGKLWRKEAISGVNARGEATVSYRYKNPVSGAVENKVTYCKKAADLAICAGYYP